MSVGELGVSPTSTGPLAARWRGSATAPTRGSSRRHPAAQVVRYLLVAGVSTATNAAVFILLRTSWDMVPANLVALVISTVISTELHRRFTFGSVPTHRWRPHLQTGGTVLFYACYSSAVLLLVHGVVDDPSPLVESVAIAVASVAGGACRFLLLRFWVFEPKAGPEALPEAAVARWAP